MILKKINWRPLSFLQLNNFCTSHQCRGHPFKFSKLLSSHFKFGRIEEAQNLFDEIPDRNLVAWSIIIHGFAKNGFHRKSLELFSQMRISGLVPNSFTWVGVLIGIGGLQDLVLGQCVHGMIVKAGFESDFIVGTAMLDVYAKCGNIFDSHKVFEALSNPSLVSCNAILAGFVYNELYGEAIALFNQFRKYGLVPNAATAMTLVQGCVALELQRLCNSIYNLVVKFGLGVDICVNNSILHMYSSLMDLDAATKIFDRMEHKDVISWTTMMSLFVRLEYAYDALDLFRKMRDSGVNHDMICIMNLISACADLGDLKRGRQIHAQAVVCGFGLKLHLANSLVSMYSKCGDLDSSSTVFDQTTEKSSASWSAMILGCVQNGRPIEALNLLIKTRQEENLFFDSIMLVGALTASGELAALELCQQLHCYAFEAGFLMYRSVQNSLISTYSKCGNVQLAHSIFKEMSYLRDIVSWNAILNGYGINGRGETALALYHEMRKGGEYPDGATYLGILSACSHAGLVEDGLMIFNEMVKDNRIGLSQEHYGCVVDLLARAGCLSDANGFVGKFLEEVSPNVWRALLSRCMLHGNVGLAELAARSLFEHKREESDQVVLLSNVYASVGRFQDAEALRLSMQKKGLVKNPGISLLNKH